MDNHSPRPVRVHNLVEKMEYQSTVPLQCGESCIGETGGYEDSAWEGGLTWCWEKKDNCSKEVTLSKQKQLGRGRRKLKHTLLLSMFSKVVSCMMLKGNVYWQIIIKTIMKRY